MHSPMKQLMNYHSSVEGSDAFSKDRLGIPPLEKNKQFKEKGQVFSSSNPLVLGTFLFALSSFFQQLFILSQNQATLPIQQKVLERVSALKNLFNILAKKDQSQDLDFILTLSTAWHALLEESRGLDLLETHYPEAVSEIKLLILHILSFPKTEEHSFGYYLNEYVGKQWLPFPFMELLSTLHKEYGSTPQSTLRQWIRTLSSIEESLNC